VRLELTTDLWSYATTPVQPRPLPKAVKPVADGSAGNGNGESEPPKPKRRRRTTAKQTTTTQTTTKRTRRRKPSAE
jgi:hypothetical protein